MDDGRGLPLIASAASDAQVQTFTRGMCHVFALALHELHGFRLRALGRPADEYSLRPWRGLSGVPDHVYCLTDSGLPVDVVGVFASEPAIQREWTVKHAKRLRLHELAVPAAGA